MQCLKCFYVFSLLQFSDRDAVVHMELESLSAEMQILLVYSQGLTEKGMEEQLTVMFVCSFVHWVANLGPKPGNIQGVKVTEESEKSKQRSVGPCL